MTEVVADEAQPPVGRKIVKKWTKLPSGMVPSRRGETATAGKWTKSPSGMVLLGMDETAMARFDGSLNSSVSMRGSRQGDGR